MKTYKSNLVSSHCQFILSTELNPRKPDVQIHIMTQCIYSISTVPDNCGARSIQGTKISFEPRALLQHSRVPTRSCRDECATITTTVTALVAEAAGKEFSLQMAHSGHNLLLINPNCAVVATRDGSASPPCLHKSARTSSNKYVDVRSQWMGVFEAAAMVLTASQSDRKRSHYIDDVGSAPPPPPFSPM